jgi:hypothetical protein
MGDPIFSGFLREGIPGCTGALRGCRFNVTDAARRSLSCHLRTASSSGAARYSLLP